MNNRSKFHPHRLKLALLGLTVVTLALAACATDPAIPTEVTPPPTTTPPPVTPPGVTPPTTPNPDIGLVPYVYDGQDHSWSDVPSTTQGASRAAITVKPGTNDLSALTYTSAKNGWGPIETNTSNGDLAAKDGNPIKIDGKLYTTGIGAHAASELIYNLNAQCTAFQTDVGVAAEVKSLGSVTFEIWVDGVKAFNTPVMTGATPHLSANVDVKGKQSLKLIVTDGGDGLNYDHADWAGAVLTGCTPTPIGPVPVVYEKEPKLITKGGTYSGNWESNDPTKPAVEIRTREPVIIENSNIRGKGNLIQGDFNTVTIRNVNGYGLNPNIAGRGVGRFADLSSVKNVTIENNYVEGTGGIWLRNNDLKNPAPCDNIKIVKNKFLNIDGRQSDGKGGFTTNRVIANMVQVSQIHRVPNIEIAWNQVINEPGKSLVEDNISMYVSSGTADHPARIHDNYVQGAYNAQPWANPAYFGGGIILGDGGTNVLGDSGYAHVYNNQVVGAMNYSYSLDGGDHNWVYNNRAVNSGRLPDGRIIPQGGGNQHSTLGVFYDYEAIFHPNSPHTFSNNQFDNNYLAISNLNADGSTFATNHLWLPACNTQPNAANNTCDQSKNVYKTATLEDEKQEFQLWLEKLKTNNIAIGNLR